MVGCIHALQVVNQIQVQIKIASSLLLRRTLAHGDLIPRIYGIFRKYRHAVTRIMTALDQVMIPLPLPYSCADSAMG